MATEATAVPSKYAALPDIDSAPDVYETPDVPTEFSYDRDSDSDIELPRSGSPSNRRGSPSGPAASENIDGARLSTAEARRKFGEATLGAGSSGGGGSEGKRRLPSRRLPPTSSYSIQEPGSAEKETTLERLRRLRSEVEELEEDVRREKLAEDKENEGVPASDSKSKGKGKKEVSPALILQQLQMLRGDLGGVEVLVGDRSGDLEGEGENEGDEKSTDSELKKKEKASAGLMAKLGFGGTAPILPDKSDGKAAKAVREIHVDPQLERRMADMEKVIGASEADVNDASPLPPPLLQTLTRLDHLLTLLTQPRHLDSISRRVKVLVSDLERLHESRRKLGDTRPLNVALSGGLTVAVGGGADGKLSTGPVPMSVSSSATGLPVGGATGEPIPPDTLQKIDSLFTLLPRLDPLLPLTPRLLTRLRSLSTLHSSAAAFGETMSGLKVEMERLAEGETGLKETLDGLETSVKENEDKVKGNLETLDERLKKLVERMDKLGV